MRRQKEMYDLSIRYKNMKDRIKKILEWTNMSQQDFANRLGISPASLSSIFTGRTNPTNNHVQAIHKVFPEIDINWLLFGEGQMLGNEGTGLSSMEPGLAEPSGEEGKGVAQSASVASVLPLADAGMIPPSNAGSSYSMGNIYHESPQSRFGGNRYGESVKNFDKRERKIKEIRVFFDDGTYESFVPSGK